MVSVAQKEFGYANGSTSAKPIFIANVTTAIDFTDSRLGTLVRRLQTAGIYSDTLVIVCAKHGQGPIDPTLVRKIAPATLQNATSVNFAQVTADDGANIWLADPTIVNVNKAKQDLLTAKSEAGIFGILAGPEVYQNGFDDSRLDPRVPYLIVISEPGVIYTSPTASKVMEHGGLNPDDRATALFLQQSKPRSPSNHREGFQLADCDHCS